MNKLLFRGPIKVAPNTMNIVQMVRCLDKDSYKVQFTIYDSKSDKYTEANIHNSTDFTDLKDNSGRLVEFTPTNDIIKLTLPGVYRFMYNGSGDADNDVQFIYLDDPIKVTYMLGAENL